MTTVQSSNFVELQFQTTPASISLEEASTITNRKKSQIHNAIKCHELNYGEIEGMRGKRIITDDKWQSFLDKCRSKDKDA